MSEQSDHEQLLISVYCELLDVDTVSVNDSFFALGGHSVLAVRLINILRARVSAEIPMRAVFESPTPATLAARIGNLRSSPRPPVVRRRMDDFV